MDRAVFSSPQETAAAVASAAASTTAPDKVACRGRGKRCKVVGCCVDLQQLNKRYNLKKRLCPEHLKAEAVQLEGCGDQLFRFCQQCGKLEHLSKFAGHRRSCRTSLLKRRTLAETVLEEQDRQCYQQQRQQQPQRRRVSRQTASSAALPEAAADAAADYPSDLAGSVQHVLDVPCRTVSAGDAAAALADAWCAADCIDSDDEHFLSCSALPDTPAAAAGSSDSFLSSLVQMEISKVLADSSAINRNCNSSSTCSPAASFVPTPVGAAHASFTPAAAAAAAELSEEQLEWMIEQELLAAGVAANPAAIAMQPMLPPQQQQQHLYNAQQVLSPVSPALLPPTMPAAVPVPVPAAYRFHHNRSYGFAPAAAAAVPGDAQAAARLERLRVQFEMLQQTMAAVQELQVQTRQLAAESDTWISNHDVMHDVCYY